MTAEFKGRREDHRLVTGQGKYTSDWNLPGQLYGAFLRSDRAHAEIVSINTRPALAMPGVVAVLTGADTAQAKLGVAQPHLQVPGQGRHDAQGAASRRAREQPRALRRPGSRAGGGGDGGARRRTRPRRSRSSTATCRWWSMPRRRSRPARRSSTPTFPAISASTSSTATRRRRPTRSPAPRTSRG